MDTTFHEVYYDVEKAIDFAFKGRFVLKFYDYLKIREAKKYEVEEFLTSTTVNELASLIKELDEYVEGGADENHKQLREGYGHIPKPNARKIRNYLNSILEDAWRYNNEKRPGKRRNTSK